MSRRVVITGMGAVTPLGGALEPAWRSLLAGRSGASLMSSEREGFEVADLVSRVACRVPQGNEENALNLDDWLDTKEQRRIGLFVAYAAVAASQAIADAGLSLSSTEEQERAGVIIGSGVGGLVEIERSSILLHEKGPRRVSPFFVPGNIANMASGFVSIRHGLKGPNNCPVTACATGAHAIGDAARLISTGEADVMLAGGAEAPMCRLTMGGFAACRALSTGYNDEPEHASRPYDRDRDGFVMGEGSGVVVLESLDQAQARGSTIYAEVLGYGMSGDAFHMTAPEDNGDGAYRAMQMALISAKLTPSDVDYVNAHATSTPLGDEIELKAVERLWGEEASNQLLMSSTKSSIGHLLGAAGAVESIFAILAMRDNIAPPTLNLDNLSIDTAINLAPHRSVPRDISIVMNNSFGFGGTNASLVFGAVA
ncbi:MAG: beta-ketoacyl-ACP synthase II [Parvularculales bacterium]